MITKKIAKKAAPLKMGGLYGAEGKALITKNADGFRQDDVYPTLEVITGSDFETKFGPTRQGWDKAIYSGGTLVNLVGKGYGVLPNIDFFGQIENKLAEEDIRVMTRAINRDNRAFAVEHILSDERFHINIKNGMDEIKPMLSFTTSYDGSTKTQGHFGFHRKVCDNGLHVSTSEIGFSMKHRGNIIEVVIPEIALLIEKFKNNEMYELKRKFEILAETPITNIGDYVRMVCKETEIFQFEKSEENEAASINAETVIDTIRRESKMLNADSSLWLGYNAFNNLLHGKMKKSFTSAYATDSKLFDFHMELATAVN